MIPFEGLKRHIEIYQREYNFEEIPPQLNSNHIINTSSVNTLTAGNTFENI